MQFTLNPKLGRILAVAMIAAYAAPAAGLLPSVAVAAPKKKAAKKGEEKPAAPAKADAKKDPKAAAPKKEERKGPAKFNAGMMLEEADKDAKADKKRDDQIEQIKKIIPKATVADKAELLFRLAELWWAKSKFKLFQGLKNYDAAYGKWMEKQDKGEDAGKEPMLEQFTREAELYRQEALRKYEEILKEFPNYDRLDEVLFAYAYNKYEVGQKELAVEKYAELIKKFPNSRFVPDAYLQMGEHFFNTNQLIKARRAYDEASKTNNGRIKYFAIYKLAWCDFNGGAYEDAITKFKEVIAAAGREKSARGLKSEALNDIVVSFAQLDVVDEAMTYFKKNASKEQSRRLISKLANQYQEAGKHESGIKAFRQLLSDDPDHPNCPEYQNAIITSYEGMRKRDMVAKEMRRLVELYRPNSPWAIKNAKNKNAIAAAYEITEGAMRTMVTEYHQEAQKTKQVETYRLARDIYKEYLDNFADSEFAYNLRYYYADILWALNEIEAASIQYAKVVEVNPQGEYSKNAAYNVLLGYEKLVQAEEGKLKIEEKQSGKIDEKASKGQAIKTTIKLDRHDKDAKAEALTAFQEKLVAAIDNYVKLYPGSDDEISVRYKAAFIYYNKNHDIEAAKRFGDIIVKWPTDQWSRKAADLTLDILNKREEWFELNRLAREFNGNKKLTGGDKEFASRISDLVEASQFNYNYLTLFQKEKKAAEAAAKFREFAGEFPKSKYTPQAIVLAMDIHTEAKQLDLGIELGEKLLKEYPTPKSVAGEDLTPRTIWGLASLYDAISDFKSAAGYYQRFAELYIGKIDPDEKEKKAAAKKAAAKPAPKKVAKKDDKEEAKEGFDGESKIADALYNAALWNEGLGNFAHAIKLYERYIKEFPTDKATPDVALKIALIYEQDKNWSEAAKHFKSYAEQYAKVAPPGRLYFAKYRELMARRELKQDKEAGQIVTELISGYGKLPKEEQEKDGALNAYAHARFLTLEPLWREYSAIKFNDLKTLRKALKSKTETMAKVEKAYTDVATIGAADWTLASVTRIGLAYHDLARQFQESPDPPGLDEEQLAMYRGELENRAFPLEDKAIAAWEGALAKSFELGVYNEYTTRAQDALNKLKTGAFLDSREVPYMGAEFFVTAPAVTDVAAPPARKEEPAPAPAPAAQPAADSGAGSN